MQKAKTKIIGIIVTAVMVITMIPAVSMIVSAAETVSIADLSAYTSQSNVSSSSEGRVQWDGAYGYAMYDITVEGGEYEWSAGYQGNSGAYFKITFDYATTKDVVLDTNLGDASWDETHYVSGKITLSEGAHTVRLAGQDYAKFVSLTLTRLDDESSVVEPESSVVVPEDSSVVEPESSVVVPEESSVVEPESSVVVPDESSVVEPESSVVVPDDSSEIELPGVELDDPTNVKYQLADNATKIRFVWIVSEADVEAAMTGSTKITAFSDLDSDPTIATTSITTAYRSIYASGEVISAPEGQVYIISPVTEGLTDSSGIRCVFSLDSVKSKYCRTYEAF